METQTVLIIGFVWPEPKSSAAGNRMMQLIALFLKQGCEVVFASTASDSEYMADLDALGITRKAIQLNSSEFDDFVTALNPAIVLFDRFMTEEQFGWRVAKHCPNALRMLDTEDLHSLRMARQKALKDHREFAVTDLFKEEMAKREVASIYRCDLTLIISEFEMELLQQAFHMDPVLLSYLPIFAAPINNLYGYPDFEQRRDFVFIGNFLHDPNKDAVQYLKKEIWPLIQDRLPKAKMHIYGAYPTQSVLQLHNPKQHFYVHGRAACAKEVISKARLLLAPLRFGAGIKGKLLEGMQFGTPSITTTIGSEAMHGDLAWNGVIADDPQDFAMAAVEWYQDENRWKQAQQNGIDLVNSRYSEAIFSEAFFSQMENVQRNLTEHRLQNFTGGMLMHHTLKSTEYMSRWIEAKNKKIPI